MTLKEILNFRDKEYGWYFDDENQIPILAISKKNYNISFNYKSLLELKNFEKFNVENGILHVYYIDGSHNKIGRITTSKVKNRIDYINEILISRKKKNCK